MSDVLETIKKIEDSYEASRKIFDAMQLERAKFVDALDGNKHPWIGKLCWFSDEKKKLGKSDMGLLKYFNKDNLINGGRPYSTCMRSYMYCRAVTESELKELLTKEQ